MSSVIFFIKAHHATFSRHKLCSKCAFQFSYPNFTSSVKWLKKGESLTVNKRKEDTGMGEGTEKHIARERGGRSERRAGRNG